MMKYVVFVDKCLELIGTPEWPKKGQIISSNSMQRMVMIFPEGITHSVIVEQLQQVYPGLRPVSAGFCSLSEDGWFCEGKSVSLKLDSAETMDANVINASVWYDLNGGD